MPKFVPYFIRSTIGASVICGLVGFATGWFIPEYGSILGVFEGVIIMSLWLNLVDTRWQDEMWKAVLN